MAAAQKLASFEPRRALTAGIASIATVIILIAMKAYAYNTGESASVLAALIDSMADAAGSVMNLLAIHLSLKPADNHHRYGHGKVEGLAALFQAGLIAAAALYLALEAGERFFHPVTAGASGVSIGIMAASVLLAAVLVLIQKASLKHAPSLAVAADKAHYGADIAVNLAVLGALIMQLRGAPSWIDPAVALAVTLWLMRTAWKVACGGIDMLLDREVTEAERTAIIACVRADADVHGLHDLRTRRIGMNLNIAFDIEVNPDLSLRNAHAIAQRVERALLQQFPNAEIMIHVDPEGEIEDSRHSIPDLHQI